MNKNMNKEKKSLTITILAKIFWVLLGTFFLGLGIACQNLSTFGQDSLSAMTFSLVYLVDNNWFNYSICYFLINLIFFIIMLFLLRNRINIGSIINFVLTGVFCDLWLLIFSLIKLEITNTVLQVVIGLLGVILSSFGVALYAGANFGIAPYDAIPIIITKRIPNLKFKYAKMLIDLSCVIVALVIGVLILRRQDIINLNTIFSFLLMGPLISLFSKVLSKTIFKKEEKVFD